MMRWLKRLGCALAGSLFLASGALAQTGKITGTVTDAETGEPLPGVNVAIQGTTQGTATDVDGYYAILNVSPGTFTLRATFIGYTPQVVENVRVNIDLTSTVNFELREEAVGMAEIVVESREPIVRPDISANVANLASEDIENLPVSSIEEVIGLQAGAEGMSIRGGSLDELAFQVDGQSMRVGRDNSSFTGVSYTSIQEVQVQTGGFNAEYGNVRSGLINIVTKDAPRNRYTVDVMTRYSPAARKHFGLQPNDPKALYMRPYVDPEVALNGTKHWDPYTQRQYPSFEGWKSVAERLASDSDPGNDLTPAQLQEEFAWQYRKDLAITDPDYTLDGSVGGPVPGLSRIGGLRFFASYRGTQEAYLIPQARSSYRDRMGHLKITSDIARGMKLQLQGMYGQQLGMNPSVEGWPQWAKDNFPGHLGDYVRDKSIIFANDKWSLQDVTHRMLGARLTHSLSAKTFYEASVSQMHTDYFSRPGRLRDTSTVQMRIGVLELDEGPLGWWPEQFTTHSGLHMGGAWAMARDTSSAELWSGQFSITSQMTRYSQLKAGFDVYLSTIRANHAKVDDAHPIVSPIVYNWQQSPVQGAGYVQNKFEFQGMVANVGLRLDYFNAAADWYVYDLYDDVLSVQYGADRIDELLEKEPTKAHVALSPRLGVSFPVTANSKLFFNYGHFRQMLDPYDIFVVQKSPAGRVARIGNPNHPMPKTISYELGYEHNLFNRFLLRLAGYYKDITEQPRRIWFQSSTGYTAYQTSLPYDYEDIRGFEVSLYKNVGKWIRGFANYTYMVRKGGDFGFGYYYENPVQQLEYERDVQNYPYAPVPEPYARINLELLVPEQFGPEVMGTHPLGDWRIDWLGSWRAGDVFSWAGGGRPPSGFRNNVRWKGRTDVDLRLSKNFETALGGAMFFVDINNVFNLRHFTTYGFAGPNDMDRYLESLHLPVEVFDGLDNLPYAFIPGDDRPGDYRRPGVEFVPIEVAKSLEFVGQPHERPLYYIQETGTYLQWREGAWKEAPPEFVGEVLENKAYIDMPNQSYLTFLNPRNVTFGLRVSL